MNYSKTFETTFFYSKVFEILHNTFFEVLLNFCCRIYSGDFKLEIYLKIAQLYLEDDDPVQAEAFINRASILQAETKNQQLQILYKVSYSVR